MKNENVLDGEFLLSHKLEIFIYTYIYAMAVQINVAKNVLFGANVLINTHSQV